MANLKISQLPVSTALQGTEAIVVVQSNTTKQSTINKIKNTLVPYNLTVSSGETVSLSNSIFDQAMLVKLTWTGGSGNMTINLPSASANVNRAIRFVSNGGFNTNTRARITPLVGETLDGSSNYYEINVSYEGFKIWSDGVEWYIIQKKA